jgi:hypothetical protein
LDHAGMKAEQSEHGHTVWFDPAAPDSIKDFVLGRLDNTKQEHFLFQTFVECPRLTHIASRSQHLVPRFNKAHTEFFCNFHMEFCACGGGSIAHRIVKEWASIMTGIHPTESPLSNKLDEAVRTVIVEELQASYTTRHGNLRANAQELVPDELVNDLAKKVRGYIHKKYPTLWVPFHDDYDLGCELLGHLRFRSGYTILMDVENPNILVGADQTECVHVADPTGYPISEEDRGQLPEVTEAMRQASRNQEWFVVNGPPTAEWLRANGAFYAAHIRGWAGPEAVMPRLL